MSAPAPPATGAPPAIDVPPAVGIVRFTGEDAAFRRLVTRGALLELVTFGFYRFWLATDMRRHLWTNTEIAGDALEYTGRAKELLLGFLVALAVLVPVFLAYFIAGLAAERVKAFASVPLYVFIFLFGQFAVYRARRYRLTRTVWRGVRFWMTGSGWSYAWRSLLWALLLVPTLGFAYPWRSAALERFKFRHTWYGNLPGRFEATGRQLFRRVWWIWLLGLFPAIAVLGGFAAIALAEAKLASEGPLNRAGGLAVALGCMSVFALPSLHAARLATEWRWWAGGIRFGAASVVSNLPRGALIGTYWALLGWVLLVLFVFAVIGAVAASLLFKLVLAPAGIGSLPEVMAQRPIVAGASYLVWYLGLLLTLGVVARIYTLQRVWCRVVRSCAVVNIAAADNVLAAGEAASALGEGLADGLDFAGF